MMAAVRGRDTYPELKIRSLLHSAGLRYRLHARDLPGRPDLVLRKYKAVIFVNGCFWHQHVGCRAASMPKTNMEFWQPKLKMNVTRDIRNVSKLRELNWRVGIVWECSIQKIPDEQILATILSWLRNNSEILEISALETPGA